MKKILQLPPHIADLIAAGEVVERPASVVKELVENAIDAGAASITVEIQNGGMSSIRVTDDGEGIPEEDLPTAFLRHATSKLRTAEDLSAIGTLGFRGEALAAISAVSRLDVFSRRRGRDAGASLSLEGGVPGKISAVGCPEGTTMVVRDLFFNTPARLKFMKRDSAEGSAVAGVVQHLSLSHPHIAFHLVKDGQSQFRTPGDSQLKNAVYAALGREFALGLQEVRGSGDGVEVSGFVSRPLCGRGNRAMQIFFVNGRFVKSQLLTAAVEEAYQNQIMKGRFPGCVLHVTLPRERVDVNVHPAKTVVKFLSDREVFSAVCHVVRDALDGGTEPAAADHPPLPPERHIVEPKKDFYRQMDAKTFRESQGGPPNRGGFVTKVPPAPSELGGRVAVSDVFRRSAPPPGVPVREVPPAAGKIPTFPVTETVLPKVPAASIAPPPAESAAVSAAPPPAEAAGTAIPAAKAPPSAREAPRAPEAIQGTLLPDAPAPWRFVGEVLRTYIVAEDGEDVWLIDKHAAHERINFDRLKAGEEPVMVQQLLTPEVLRLSPEDTAALTEHLPLLSQFGFEAEDFGGGSLVVRSIPADIDAGAVGETLEELAQRLRTAGSADSAAARDAMLHTMACKAAIKGGWHSDERELRALIGRVQSGEVRYCPHGRPVAVKLTKYELEKMFKRA